MTPVDLYDATRGIWRIGPDREKVELAFAVYQDVVREVYRVTQWFRAGTTFSTRMSEEVDLYDEEKFEFVGVLAEENVRKKYIDGSVEQFFGPHIQTPFRYVNIKEN